ncbi:MAG: vWA domain-containing protein [Caldilineaceae bacterium]
MKRVHASQCILLVVSLLLPMALPVGAVQCFAAVAVQPDLYTVPLPIRHTPNPTPDPNQPLPPPPVPIVPLRPAVVLVPPSVTPVSQEVTLSPGTTDSFQITVNTGDAPIDKADLMFAFDLTGSMGEEVAAAKASGLAIAQQIHARLANTWFGVSNFMDYPGHYDYPGYSKFYGFAADGDVPWRLDRNPSLSLPDFEAAVNSLVLGNGEDWPEDYTRFLYELGQLPEIGWRKGAKKIVVLFVDAPTHDLDFRGFKFGGDPGRNTLKQDGDDLDFETVVGDLRAKQIAVIAADSGGTPESAATFQGMSIGAAGLTGTNGLYYQLVNTATLVSDVVNLVRVETQAIDELSLEVSPCYASWVNVTPRLQTNVLSNTMAIFNVTITPPVGTRVGLYAISIQTVGDGAILGTTTVYVTVPLTTAPIGLDFLPSRDRFGSATFICQGAWPMFESLFGSEQVEYTNGSRIDAADQFFENSYSVARHMSYGLAGLSLANGTNLAPSAGAPVTYALPRLDPLATNTSGGFSLAIRDDIVNGALTQPCVDGVANTSAFCAAYGKSPVQQYNYVKNLIDTDTPAVVTLNYYTPTNSSQQVAVSLAPYRLSAPANPNVRYVDVYDPYRPISDNRRLRFDLTNNTLRHEVALKTTNVITVVAWSQIGGGPRPLPVQDCQLSITPAEFLLRKGVPQWEVPIVRAATAAEERPQVFVLKGSASLLVEDDGGRRPAADGLHGDGGFTPEAALYHQGDI